jgi:hypothetical protein
MTAIALDLAVLAPVLILGLASTSFIASTLSSTVFRTPIDAPTAYGAIRDRGADDTQLRVGIIYGLVVGRLNIGGLIVRSPVVDASNC